MTQVQQDADRQVTISTGASRTDLKWRSRTMGWAELVRQLSRTTRTRETMAEYKAMGRDEKGRIKDVGGFVGGVLAEGRRKKGSVKWRTLITLDADHVRGDMWASVESLTDWACVMYSTHSHEPGAPRLRLVIPLAEPVRAEDYEPVARMAASSLGMELFDDTTYEAHRLMYWPSTSADGEYLFRVQDGPWMDPAAVLSEYTQKGLDPHDPMHWPRSTRETATRRREAQKAGDPTAKPGLIGAFCRAYTIEDAIDKFLPDRYEKAAEGRWTFAGGSTVGGLVLYDDGLFCFSHHESDPVGGRMCNAWDLVRLHLFGDLDDGAAEDAPVSRLKSHAAMMELAQGDDEVRRQVVEAQREAAAEDFADPVEDEDWMKKLELDRRGGCAQTINNARLVLEHDAKLAGKVAYNAFSCQTVVRGDLPWRKAGDGELWGDGDDAGLRLYMEQAYGISQPAKIADAMLVVRERHSFHPVREYLAGLEWDGIDRVDTLLVDYLGALDTPYVRAVTRKTLTAAVARIMTPGCKFDNMLTLIGRQGIGKSTMFRLLGRQWFSDTFSKVDGKDSFEQLQSAWIIEMSELSGMRKSDAESVKHFISKAEDMYRVPYGRHVSRFPRQCVFVGTTNEVEFLKDTTGNRRFWPVEVGKAEPALDLFAGMTEQVVGLIWAEAVHIWKGGEKLYLDGTVAAEALERQESHRETDPRVGEISEFLDTLLPANWTEMDTEARRRFLTGTEFGRAEGTERRERVCAAEILVELFGYERGRYERFKAMEINAIMRNMPGWAEMGRLGKFGAYGPQRGFERVTKSGG